MKKLFLLAALLYLSLLTFAEVREIPAQRIDLSGSFGEFHVRIRFDIEEPGCYFVTDGSAALKEAVRIESQKFSFWNRSPEAAMHIKDGKLCLDVKRRGIFTLDFTLYPPVGNEGALRSIHLLFPPAVIGNVSLRPDADGSDFKLADGLLSSGKPELLQWAWSGGKFDLTWQRSAIAGASSDVVISADALSAARISAGVLKVDSIWEFKITRGKPTSLEFQVPSGWNIASVTPVWGNRPMPIPAIARPDLPKPIWKFDHAKRLLTVTQDSGFADSFFLKIQSELPMPTPPGTFILEPIQAVNVVPGDFYWMLSSDEGLRFRYLSGSGLIQSAENQAALLSLPEKPLPNAVFYSASKDFKSVFELSAVTPDFTSESTANLTLRDGGMAVSFFAELEIRDAALPYLELEFDANLNFNRVISNEIIDTTVTERSKTRKLLRLELPPKTLGKVDFSAIFECDQKNSDRLDFTGFKLLNARSTRGNFTVSAEKGLNLTQIQTTGLTPINASSLRVRTPGLLQAYLYRNEAWSLSGVIESAPRHITGEVFSLISAGENNAYGFTLFTGQLAGAPADQLIFKVSNQYENLEFSGVPLLGAKRLPDQTDDGFSRWEVRLREKLSGPFVLLATYEIARRDDRQCPAGAIMLEGAEPEALFFAISGSQSMRSIYQEPIESDAFLRQIEPDDLPAEYRGMIGNSLLQVFRSDRATLYPTVQLTSFAQELPPPTLIDSIHYSTRIDSNGNSVTTATLAVKNSSAQFLTVKLPEHAKLWQIKADGKPERGSSSNNLLMIPLRRPERINEIIPIELTYAQEFPQLSKAGVIALQLPELAVPVRSCELSLQLPGNVVLLGSNPALPGQNAGFRPGLSDIFAPSPNQGKLFQSILWGLGVLLTPLLLLFAYGAAKKRKICQYLGLFASLSVLVVMGLATLGNFVNYYRNTLRGGNVRLENQFTFTEEAALTPQTKIIELEVAVNGYSGLTQAVWYILAMLVALALTMVLEKKKYRKCAMAAGAIAFASFCGALSQFMFGLAILHWGLLLAIPVLLPMLIAAKGFAFWKKTATLLLCTMFLPLFGVEVKDYRYELRPAAENLHWSARIVFDAEQGEIFSFFPEKTIFRKLTLPEKTVLTDKTVLESQTEIRDGVLIFEAILPVAEDGSFLLPVPPALSGVLTAYPAADAVFAFPDAIRQEKVQSTPEESGIQFFFPASGSKGNGSLKKEEKVQISELQGTLSTMLTFRRDVTLMQLHAQLNIPQGKIDRATFLFPDGMTVRKVTGEDLNAWQFDAETHQLHVFFNQEKTGSLPLDVSLSMPREKLPSPFVFTAPTLSGASMTLSKLSIAATPELRVTEKEVKGFTKVTSPDSTRSWSSTKSDCSIRFEVAEITPELRIAEQSEVRFEDDRIHLTSLVTLDVVKGGIFSSSIQLPEGFEIIKISGAALAHWNEERDGKNHRVELHFRNVLKGKTQLTIELAKLTTSPYTTLSVPKLGFGNADKLSGSLSVFCERGTALVLTGRNGVSISENSKVVNSNSLYFKLLNPDWQVDLRFDAAPAWIQAETFADVKMRLNHTECEVTSKLKIENNSVKTLKVTLPDNFSLPEFESRDLLRSIPLDKHTWQLEFSGKIEKQHTIKIRGKLLADKDGKTLLSAIRFPDASSQTGYAAIRTGDSLEYKPAELSGDAGEINPRNLPPEWIDSGKYAPVASLRTVGTEWQAKLSTVSNASAGVLKLAIGQITIRTRLAPNGVAFHQSELLCDNSGENFLAFQLPPKARYWGAKVNDVPVETVRNADGQFLIPLENGPAQKVTFLYSTLDHPAQAKQEGKFTGPTFAAPLKNIQWLVSIPHEYSLRYTGGNLEEKPLITDWLPSGSSLGKDKSLKQIEFGRKLKSEGKLQQFNKTLQSAIDMTSDAALRNDLQGEMLLYNRESNINNLNSRQNMIVRNNQSGEAPSPGAIKPADGEIQKVADNIFVQQQALYAPPQIFELPLNMPGHPQLFERALEIKTNAPLELEFKLETSEANWLKQGLSSSTNFLLLTLLALLTLILLPRRNKE